MWQQEMLISLPDIWQPECDCQKVCYGIFHFLLLSYVVFVSFFILTIFIAADPDLFVSCLPSVHNWHAYKTENVQILQETFSAMKLKTAPNKHSWSQFTPERSKNRTEIPWAKIFNSILLNEEGLNLKGTEGQLKERTARQIRLESGQLKEGCQNRVWQMVVLRQTVVGARNCSQWRTQQHRY